MSADATLKDVIDQRTQRGPLAWLVSRQIFWILLAVVLAVLAMSILTTTFATPNNLFNVTRNFAFVGIVGNARQMVGGSRIHLGQAQHVAHPPHILP